MMHRIVGWIIIILIVIWIVANPGIAGHTAHIWATNLGFFFAKITCSSPQC
jgi:hypothetical protein